MNKQQINYVTCVIGAISLMTGKPCGYVYKILQTNGIIKDYLAKSYEILHTFSLEYVAKDVINLLKQKGNPLC